MARVRLGYFEDFKSNDTLLIDGDAEGLRHLAGTLRTLKNGSTSRAEIHALPFVESHHGVRLIAMRASRDLVTRAGSSSNEFKWERTELGWPDVVDKLEVLVECQAGHHYLDVVGDEVVVEVSKGEYEDGWWTHHG